MSEQLLEVNTPNPFSQGGVQIMPQSNAVASVESSRAIQQVQAAMIVAKNFPRDEAAAYSRIMQSCQRIALAETAIYAYPKGGQMVKGVSIHLAKVVARNWGNLDFGIRELSQANGESQVEAFCWDMETNVRETKVFTVRHERDTKQGKKTITDGRDIYELVANMGARRMRACILGVVPPDVVQSAKEACEKTMAKGGGDIPLVDRVRTMIVAFEKIGVDKDLIEKRLGHKVTAIVETQLVELRQIFNSIQQGMADRSQFFDVVTSESAVNDLNEKLKMKNNTPEPQPKTQPEPKQAQTAQPTTQQKVDDKPKEPAAVTAKRESTVKLKNDEFDLPNFG